MNLFKYLQEVRSEISKVTWPTRAQATQMTINVLVASFFISVFIASVDWLFVRALETSLFAIKSNPTTNVEPQVIDIQPEDIQVETTPVE